MKVLKKFTPRRFANRIPYKSKWFTGNIVLLTAEDLGPGDSLTSKAVSLRSYATRNLGCSLKMHLDHDNWTIQLQAVY